MQWLRTFIFGILAFAEIAWTQSATLSPEQKRIEIDSFEAVWRTIRDNHWETNPGGLDWQAIHDEYRPKIEAAKSAGETRAILREMIGRLKQTHFAIMAADVYQDLAQDAVPGAGWPGFETRVLDGRVIVTETTGDSVVKCGWEVLSVGNIDLRALVGKLKTDPAITELALERAVSARLTGVPGETKRFVFDTGERNIKLLPPRGNPASFGNLPMQFVWFESKKIGNIGYIRFNEFLDLVRIMGEFGRAVENCSSCDGLVIDLRGNAGGIGGMAMGMAGWLVDKPDQKLGTMYMRGATLKFVVNPRAGAYTGPVAVLVDGTSASTSEIFAGGLKDLGRARIFGARTAAAALPSMFTRLPNGDGFQYAIANYISEGGTALEGNGVTPDVQVKLTRDGLLAGHDAVLDAALEWIGQNRRGTTK